MFIMGSDHRLQVISDKYPAPQIVFIYKSKKTVTVILIIILVVSMALRYRHFALTPLSSHLVFSRPSFLPRSENP
jgi:hypothetical protein